MQVERRADAHRDAVDARDHRLLRLRQRQQEIPDLAAALAARRHDHEIGKVVARRKRTGDTEEDMDADIGIGVARGERRCHRGVHGAGDGVLLVGAVHADDLNGAIPLDTDMLGHVENSFPLTMPRVRRRRQTGCRRPR